MPVVSMMRFSGDPGGLINIVARDGDNGILVINVWETEAGRHAIAAEPEIQDALQKAGLQPPNFQGYPIERLRVSDRALAAAKS